MNWSLHRIDDPEEAVVLILNARREEELVGLTPAPTIAEGQGPEPIEDEGLAVLVRQYAQRCSRCRIERIDAATPEIADEQIIAKATEIGGSQRHSPGQIEWTTANQAFEQVSIGIEDVHKAMSPAYFTVLSCIEDVELAADILNVEWGIPLWNAGVMKTACQCGRGKVLIIYIDGACTEIGSVEQGTGAVTANSQSGVDRSRLRVIDHDNSMGAVNCRAPTGDGAGESIKEEQTWTRHSVRGNRECARRVKDIEDGPRWQGDWTARTGWNGDDERYGLSLTIVECGHAGTVIRHPERAGGAQRDAPGIDQVWIRHGSNTGKVRDEVGFLIESGVRVGVSKGCTCLHEQQDERENDSEGQRL